MTTFEQALHILRKDARHLRLEIAGVLLLLVFLVATGVQTWEGLQRRGGPEFGEEGPLSVLLAVTWSLLIARAIQTEALPGDRHFWLTRPYSRASLALGKAMFLAVFINLPFLIAQAMIISFDGLPLLDNAPGLLWNQVLISAMLLLPVAAVAALTRNLAQFLPVAVLTVAVTTGLVSQHRRTADPEWIQFSVGMLVAAAIAVLVLWRQYRLRRSGNTALLAIGASAVGLLVYLSFTRSVAFAIQSKVIGGSDGQFSLSLAKAAPRKPEAATANRYQQVILLPIDVTGADPRDVYVESFHLAFKTLSGITRRPWARVEVTDQGLVLKTSLDRNFFDAAKNSPVNLQAEFSLTQYGSARSVEAPLDGTPVYLVGPGQCGVVANFDHRMFVCRSAFQRPKTFLSDRLEKRYRDDVYSPFHTQPRIYPVVARTYELSGGAARDLAPAAPERPVTMAVRDPVASFRYTMEASGVRLADFAVTESDDDER